MVDMNYQMALTLQPVIALSLDTITDIGLKLQFVTT